MLQFESGIINMNIVKSSIFILTKTNTKETRNMKTLYVNGIEMNDESQYDTMDEAMLRSKVRKLNKRLEYGNAQFPGFFSLH